MFKRYYEDELEFLREMGTEFSASFPEIAAELGLGSRDPDIERLLQGFAFLTARIRETLDGEFPELLYPLMTQIWPHAIRPSPAAGIVEFKPVAGMFQEVYHLKRGSTVQSIPIDGTACQFRTAYDLRIVPWTVEEARLDAVSTTQNELYVRLQVLPGAILRQMAGIPLRLHFHGSPRQSHGLYLAMRRDLRGIRVRFQRAESDTWEERLIQASALKPVGWTQEEALLPYPPFAFRGYRHLHEYFLFPAKYLFVDVEGLDFLADYADIQQVELRFELGNPQGESLSISKDNVRLHCVPVVNLFPHPARTLRVEETRCEYLLRPEGSRPEHFDVYSIEKVTGYSRKRGKSVVYYPFFSFYRPPAEPGERPILYQIHLRPSVSRRQSAESEQSSYPGVDTYISFVEASGDAAVPPTTLSIDLMVTNRDLPRRLRTGDVSVPSTDIPSLVTFSNLGPFSVAAPAPVGRDGLWRYFAHLSLGWNYLVDREALAGLLTLYDFPAFYDQRARQSLELLLGSIVSVTTTPEHRLIGRPPALVRGTHIQLKMHEGRFSQLGELYLFGTVLSHFLGEVTTINTFSRLSIAGVDNGLEWTWEPRTGRQSMV